jgi:hypothetical protein
MRRFELTPERAGVRRAAYTRLLLASAFAAGLALPFLGGAPTPASADDGLIHMAVKPGESQARYVMTVKTLGQAPKQAACATNAVTGEVVLNPDGSIVPEMSKISVDQRTLKCEAPLRDSMAQSLLQTSQHPMAEFQVNSAPGLGVPLPTGDAAFQFVGDQQVRGISQPTTYDTTANLTPDSMTGQAHATLKMTSFGITPPSIGPLIQVSDDMEAQVDLKMSVAGTAAAPAGDPAASDEDAPADAAP